MVKKFIQVRGNPQYATPIRPHAILKCPTTGVIELCQFPACAHFAGGPVHLREGKHYGPNRGHGFQHIWQEHHATETDRARAEVEIFAVIRAVLIVGASIHYEAAKRDRASVSVRSPVGLVIVQENLDQKNVAVYHIVTAFGGQPHGQLIGRIGAPESNVKGQQHMTTLNANQHMKVLEHLSQADATLKAVRINSLRPKRTVEDERHLNVLEDQLLSLIGRLTKSPGEDSDLANDLRETVNLVRGLNRVELKSVLSDVDAAFQEYIGKSTEAAP